MKFLVIGDSCIDKFIYGECNRICPEAPVPVFNPTGATSNGGMSKNVQANVLALGVECDIVTQTNEIEKKRFVDRKTNQMLLRVDVDDRATDFFNHRLVDYSLYDAILISDYGKGFIGHDDVNRVCLQHDNVFLDTKSKIKYDLPKNLKFLKINQYELELNDFLKLHLSQMDELGERIIVTHGDKGCKYMGMMYPPRERVIAQDLSGAGDTFFAAFVYGFMDGRGVVSAIKLANEAASRVVSQRGVTTP